MVTKIATRQATPPDRVKPTLTLPTGAAIGVIMGSVSGDLAVALHVLAATGVRRGELVGLQWTDVDGDQLVVQRSILTLAGGGWMVKSTKGKRPRRVALDPDTMRRLVDHAQTVAARAVQLAVQTPWMFPDFRGDPTGRTPHRPGWLSGEWGKLRRKHGASSVRLHDLRHWHASVLIRRGVDFTEISDRLGHAQTSTTMDIYGHLLPDKGGRAAAAIAAEMGALPS
jgi:integrase